MDVIYLNEELLLELDLPLDVRLFPSIKLTLKEKKVKSGKVQQDENIILAVCSIDLFEHYVEEFVHLYTYLYDLKEQKNEFAD